MAKIYLVLSFLFTVGIASSSKADLKIQFEEAKGKKASGGSKLGKGNSKGQTFSIEKISTISGITVEVGSVSKGDLVVSFYQAKKDAPVGEAIVSESGEVLATSGKGVLTIELSKPLRLEPGNYAMILETQSADLLLVLNSSNVYTSGSLIRKNSGTKGQWKLGNGNRLDIVMALQGEVDLVIPSGASSKRAAEEEVELIALKPHNNPDYPVVNRADLPKNPNLIVCMVDDLGWNQIGVPQGTIGTQQKKFTTPNLAKIASEGLSFAYAYAQPNCAPTRAAMLSGQYPARIHNDVYVVGSLGRHGRGGISKDKAKFDVPKQTEDVAAEAVTVAEALKKNGYATAHIGKYHVGGHGGEKTLPENVGFDINIGGFSQGHQPVCFAKENDEGEWVFRGLGRGHFDRFGKPYTQEYLEKYGFPESLLGKPKHVSDAVADAVEETIGKFAEQKAPFYLQLHPYAVHGPVQSRPDLKAAANGDNLAGFVSSIDLILGRLLKLLDDPNLDGDRSDSIADNTLVMFTSDNGGTHGHNRPLRGKKGMFTEGGIRVPLIAYWPGVIPKNVVTHAPVHSVDYYPTLLQLAGNSWQPDEAEHPLDGTSFVDVLLDPETEQAREPIYYFFPGYLDQRAQPCASIIERIGNHHFKLHYDYESAEWALYQVDEDLAEQSNLIDSKPDVAERLSKKLHAWLSKQHPTWNPKYPVVKSTGESAGPPPIFTR